VLLQQALEKAEERIAALEAELKGAASN
jgi:hypothetical protein